MSLCPSDFQHHLEALCIGTQKYGWHCVCLSHLISIPNSCLECVHASGHVLMSIWLSIVAPPLCIITWKHGCHCVAQWVCPSHPLLVPHLDENVYMHQYTYTCPSDSPHQHHPLSIVTWNHRYHCASMCDLVTPLQVPYLVYNVYMHQYMYLCLPDSQCLLHLISILTLIYCYCAETATIIFYCYIFIQFT